MTVAAGWEGATTSDEQAGDASRGGQSSLQGPGARKRVRIQGSNTVAAVNIVVQF
jgi:hypothetical protein